MGGVHSQKEFHMLPSLLPLLTPMVKETKTLASEFLVVVAGRTDIYIHSSANVN
jgi:hypothetical protein